MISQVEVEIVVAEVVGICRDVDEAHVTNDAPPSVAEL